MAEDFQAGIFGGNWWNPSRSLFSGPVASPCSMGLGSDVAGFGWPSHDSNNNNIDDSMVDHHSNNNNNNNNSSGDTNNSVCESPSIAFQEVLQKPNNHNSSPMISSTTIDSTLQMMGFNGLSPSDLSDSNNLVRSNGIRPESIDINNTIYSMLEEDLGLTKLSTSNSISNSYRQDHQIEAALSSGFPVSSGSYGYNSAALLHSLFDGESHQQQQPFPSNNNNNNNRYTNYSSNFESNNGVAWQRHVSSPKQLSHNHHHQAVGSLHFSNDTPFWNASEQVLSNSNNSCENDIRSGLNTFPSAVPRLLHHQYATPTFEQKPKSKANNMVCNEDQVSKDTGLSCGVKKSSSGNEQPVIKRARIETPSPLPTFKVRKEKLGDRITALQQLVSPFGKTDTASVLHEAIEYIKFLHDQVLSTPYMKNGAPIAQANQQGSNKLIKNNQETTKQDLKSRGLCLVPISSTFPVANETTADFWTPTFGGTFR